MRFNIKRLLPFAVGMMGGAFCSFLYFKKALRQKELVIQSLLDELCPDKESEKMDDSVPDIPAETPTPSVMPVDYSRIFQTKSQNEDEKKSQGVKTGLNLISEEEAADYIQREGYSINPLDYYALSDDMIDSDGLVDDRLQHRLIGTVGYESLLSCVDDTIFWIRNDEFHIVYEIHSHPGMTYKNALEERGIS